MSNDLPPLPEPSDMDGARWGYTADDMRGHAIDAYAAGVAAERERFAQIVRDFPHWLGPQAKAELLAALGA
jgi:hypothetical protein